MPIRVRYGNAGTLGSLASEAGQGSNFWRRHQAGQQLVESQRAYNQREDELALQAFQLQDAANARAARMAQDQQLAQQQMAMDRQQMQMQQQRAAMDYQSQMAQQQYEQQRANQARQRIAGMAQRGQLSPEAASRAMTNLQAGYKPFTGRPSQESDQTYERQIAAAKAKEELADQRIQQYQDQIERSADPDAASKFQQQLQEAWNQKYEAIQQQQRIHAGEATGALGGGGGGGDTIQEGAVARNAQGQKLQYRNGEWIPYGQIDQGGGQGSPNNEDPQQTRQDPSQANENGGAVPSVKSIRERLKRNAPDKRPNAVSMTDDMVLGGP